MVHLNEELDAAIGRGIDYILEQQDATGSWTDWMLPPGPSSEWTTAYVGYRLCSVGAPLSDRLAGALARAAAWLLDRRLPDGGWGYNATVAPDADSTALAILFLSKVVPQAPQQAYAFLRRFQRQDGGFSTFLPDGLTGSWGCSHPEITPIALLALLTNPAGCPGPVIDQGVGWIRRSRRLDGTWNAFWWTHRFGATQTNLALLAAIGCPGRVPPVLKQMNLTDSLQSAVLLSAITAEACLRQIEALSRRLIGTQAVDGTWCSGPTLRITRRDCASPWDQADAGPLFSDCRRVFTTATVIDALSKAQMTWCGATSYHPIAQHDGHGRNVHPVPPMPTGA